MSKLLKEYIGLILESPKSDAFEKKVASAINKVKLPGLSAVQSGGDTRFADVRVSFNDIEAYVEAKMSHTDPAGGNPRFFVMDDEFISDYDTPTARLGEELLNSSPEARAWLNLVKFYMGYEENEPIDIGAYMGAIDDKEIIEAIKKASRDLGSQYIMKSEIMSFTELVTGHYVEGKAAPTDYIQMGDDFYLIGTNDPLGLRSANKKVKNPNIPMLTGQGQYKVRVSFRTNEMEIFPELKISEPPTSDYSVFGGKKINPFGALK